MFGFPGIPSVKDIDEQLRKELRNEKLRIIYANADDIETIIRSHPEPNEAIAEILKTTARWKALK